jgi:hypothetical protein
VQEKAIALPTEVRALKNLRIKVETKKLDIQKALK